MTTTSELGGAVVRDLDVRGVPLQVTEIGGGPPLLFLHGLHGLGAGAECFQQLAQRFRVLLPVHPGFELSRREPWFNSVEDLAYLYLDLLEELDLRDVHLVGSSFGGWVAAEVAVRSQERLSDLVLVDPVGIKVSDRWTRDIADVFVLDADEVLRRAFADQRSPVDPAQLSDEELTARLRNSESVAVYAWEPYLYNPKLRRQLGRITIPTLLLWGAQDGIVSPDYGRAFQQSVPNSQLIVIERAAHYPHIDQPHAFIEHLNQFLTHHGPADSISGVAGGAL